MEIKMKDFGGIKTKQMKRQKIRNQFDDGNKVSNQILPGL